MNHIYKSVYSVVLATYVAVSEHIRTGGKVANASKSSVTATRVVHKFRGFHGMKTLTLALITMGIVNHVRALPINGQVMSGSVDIKNSTNNMTLHQLTPGAIINWSEFNIKAGETLNVIQPHADARLLNRVTGNQPSEISGKINGNGKIFLVNPNGVLFGANSQINVSGLVASTLNISDQNFMASRYRFDATRNATAQVINLGNIQGNGGTVTLLGQTVINSGTIQSPLGEINLVAANQVDLLNAGTNMSRVILAQEAPQAVVSNTGVLQADGGKILLTTQSTINTTKNQVSNIGTIQANTVGSQAGEIWLLGGMLYGTVQVNGKLQATATNQNSGGFIETSAGHVKVASDSLVSTASPQGKSGTWLIDPQDFNIGSPNSQPLGNGSNVENISGAMLSQALSQGNVSILSSTGTGTGLGNINVNAPVNWSQNRLTLTAANDININAVMTASGTSTLSMNPATTNGLDSAIAGGSVKVGITNQGFRGKVDFGPRSGANILNIGNLNYSVINTLDQLQTIPGTGNFALGSDLGTPGSTFAFVSIPAFANNFNGLGHTIHGMTINAVGSANAGMFAVAGALSDIRNLGLMAGSVGNGGAGTGGLIGSGTTGRISNSFNTGTVQGAAGTGGLVGSMTNGTIQNSFTTGKVTGHASTGGLVGYLTHGSIINSNSIADVVGNAGTGGLIGMMTHGIVGQSYATGSVNGNAGVGGLIGSVTTATINDVFATGNVTGTSGGVGGLLGDSTAAVTNAYAMGSVVGGTASGLMGSSTGTLSNVFWLLSNSPNAVGVAGIIQGTQAIIQPQSLIQKTFTNFDFDNIWVQPSGGLPQLRVMKKPNALVNLTVTAVNQNRTYDGTAFDLSNSSLTYSLDASLLNHQYLTQLRNMGDSQGARNVLTGGYSIVPRYADQDYYNITYVSSTLNIEKRSLTAQISDGNTVYGAELKPGIIKFNNLISGDIVNALQPVTINTEGNRSAAGVLNAGNHTGIQSVATGLKGESSINYNFLGAVGNYTVTPAEIQLSGVKVNNRIYDGTKLATIDTSQVTYRGLLAGDTWVMNVTGEFLDKNAEANKGVKLMVNSSLNPNYTIAPVGNLTASITPRKLTVSSANTVSKVYDGNINADVQLVSDALLGDDIRIIQAPNFWPQGTSGMYVGTRTINGVQAIRMSNSAAQYVDKNAGVLKTIDIFGISTVGLDSANYSVAAQAQVMGSIVAKPIFATAVANNKIYDGTNNAMVKLTSDGILAGDAITFAAAAAQYGDKNAAADKEIAIVGITARGRDQFNYQLMNSTATVRSDITPRKVTVTASADSRAYDATIISSVKLQHSNVIKNDDIAWNYESAMYLNKNVGVGKSIDVKGIKMMGSDAGNYVWNATAATRGTITPRVITITALGTNKLWDSRLTAEVTLTSNEVLAGDTVQFTKTRAQFIDPHVGINKPVLITGIKTRGVDSKNYSVDGVASTVATVLPTK